MNRPITGQSAGIHVTTEFESLSWVRVQLADENADDQWVTIFHFDGVQDAIMRTLP